MTFDACAAAGGERGNEGGRDGALGVTPPSRAVQLKNISKAKTGTKIVPHQHCASEADEAEFTPWESRRYRVILWLWC